MRGQCGTHCGRVTPREHREGQSAEDGGIKTRARFPRLPTDGRDHRRVIWKTNKLANCAVQYQNRFNEAFGRTRNKRGGKNSSRRALILQQIRSAFHGGGLQKNNLQSSPRAAREAPSWVRVFPPTDTDTFGAGNGVNPLSEIVQVAFSINIISFCLRGDYKSQHRACQRLLAMRCDVR